MPLAMPHDIRLMNAVSTAFMLVFAGLMAALAVAWLMRQPLFGLSAIVVHGDVKHHNAVTLRANVTPKLVGNFFTVDLAQTRAIFQAVPWVRSAEVRRQFPNRLKVVLQEHQAVAYWGDEADTRFLNNFGEVFEAGQSELEFDALPQLNGPTGQAGLVLQAYTLLAPLFEKLDAALDSLELTGQGSWRARLDTGAELELGQGRLDEIDARARRFIATLAQVTTRYGNDFEYADLRYSNGYALKIKGVTTLDSTPKEDKKAIKAQR